VAHLPAGHQLQAEAVAEELDGAAEVGHGEARVVGAGYPGHASALRSQRSCNSQMLRYWTGLPWSCNMIGPGWQTSPPRPAVVLFTGISTLSWIFTPLCQTVMRACFTFLPSSHTGAVNSMS